MLSLLVAATLLTPSNFDTTGYSVAGWTVRVSNELLRDEPDATEKALTLIDRQLREVVRVVPAPAVAKLKKVPLWLTPGYPGIDPTAEYHVSAGWLRQHGRNPAMERSVEFSNVLIFEQESQRMPMMVLHELAHAYHHQVLPNGYRNADVLNLYNQAKKSGMYDRVERRDHRGRSSFDVAYAILNQNEYFAENTEAFFGRNDYFPFTRDELRRHDPKMHDLLQRLWNLP